MADQATQDYRGPVPESLAEVPLPRRDPLTLLNLQADEQGQHRATPDHDFWGYGWGVVEGLVLESADGTRRSIERALVLALHSADEQPDAPGIELEIDIPDPIDPVEAEPLTVMAPLSAFLRAQLPQLPAEPADLVLALCNPRNEPVEREAALGQRRLHFAHGDVLSWLDVSPEAPARIRLHAKSWHQR